MEPKDYTNHSGGAQGADLTWDLIGRKYGVINHVHYRPEHLKNLTEEYKTKVLQAVHDAAIALARPNNFRGIELVQRNWLQIHNSEAIYAISHIVQPLAIDKGFINRSGKQVVSGGTGWAVEMAIQGYMPVYVFDMSTNQWYMWSYSSLKFDRVNTPILTQAFAGIGSRALAKEGIQAIEDVYIKTFSNGKEK